MPAVRPVQAMLPEGGPHCISSSLGCCRPARLPGCTACLLSLAPLPWRHQSWHGPMRGQLYSEEGPRDGQFLLSGQVTWSGRVELSSSTLLQLCIPRHERANSVCSLLEPRIWKQKPGGARPQRHSRTPCCLPHTSLPGAHTCLRPSSTIHISFLFEGGNVGSRHSSLQGEWACSWHLHHCHLLAEQGLATH